MEIYVIKSAVCLGIFFAFYKIFLEGENMHIFKRFYLVGTLVASYFIPLVTFTKYIEVQKSAVPLLTSDASTLVSSEIIPTINYVPMVLWSLYGLGVLFFSLKFGQNLYRIIQKIRKNPLYKSKNIFHVLLKKPTTPHTFFSYIFLNKQKFEANEIPKEVLIHEQAHAYERHSLDVLFIELLQIVFWFNPIIYFIKHSIKLNHEFLADRAVLNNGIETTNYQNILLAFSSNAGPPLPIVIGMANSINYSFIKKRITVMKSNTSKRAIWLRSIFLLPLLAALIYGFSTKEVLEMENLAPISQINDGNLIPEPLPEWTSPILFPIPMIGAKNQKNESETAIKANGQK
jgi:bla regulator protein blaR1